MDWNNDGRHDLLIGDSEGRVLVFLNTNTNTHPILFSGKYVRAAGEDINVGERAAPFAADWNGDGKKDLLVGEMEGYVYFLKNSGTNNKPVFERAGKLFLRDGNAIRYPDKDNNARSRLFVTDWNNDGHSDLLLGGRDGRVLLYESAAEPSYSPMVITTRIWNQLKETSLKFKRYLRKLARIFLNKF